MSLKHSSSGWFEASACTAAPGGRPPSLVQHGPSVAKSSQPPGAFVAPSHRQIKAARCRSEHAVEPPRPSRLGPEIRRQELRRYPDGLGPAVRHLSTRGRNACLRHQTGDQHGQSDQGLVLGDSESVSGPDIGKQPRANSRISVPISRMEAEKRARELYATRILTCGRAHSAAPLPGIASGSRTAGRRRSSPDSSPGDNRWRRRAARHGGRTRPCAG